MRILFTITLCLFSAALFAGTDIQRGYTPVDGQRLTAEQLKQLVDNAIILSTFYSAKTLQSSFTNGGDKILLLTPGGNYRVVTAENLLLNNTRWIDTRTEKTNLASGDYLPLYDVSGGVIAKVSFANLTFNTNSFSAYAAATNPVQNFTFVGFNGTNLFKFEGSNLFYVWSGSNAPTFTNLTTHTEPTNTDRFWVWSSTDGTNGTNMQISLSTLFTNLHTVPRTNLNLTDTIPFFSTLSSTNAGTNNNVAKMTLQSLASFASSNLTVGNGLALSNGVLVLTNFSTGTNIIAVPTSNLTLTNLHGLGVTPSRVSLKLLCVTNDLGWLAGDEVDINGVWEITTQAPVFTISVNDTQVILACGTGTANWRMFQRNSASSSGATIDKPSWRVKIYASP